MLNRRLFLVVLVLFLCSIIVTAQDDIPIQIENYTLENGLEVILVQDNSAPTVAVDIWYDVGSNKDPEGRSGFAHLFEHMMFEGSAHVGSFEHGTLIEAVGGIVNAYTVLEHTSYYNAIPSNQLPLALWLEADRMSSLRVNQENFNNQRAIVIEEYQLRYANSPYGPVFKIANSAPYDYEPYQRPTIGSVEDLNAAEIDEVRAFHSTYYVPNNATLVIAGDIDLEGTREMVDTYFAPIPAGDEPPQLPEYEPTTQTEVETFDIPSPLANLPLEYITYVVPPRDTPDFAATEVLAYVLGQGNSSRLRESMIDTGKALDFGAFTQGNRGPSLFSIAYLPNQGIELSELQTIAQDELDRITNEGVSDEELEKVINQIRSERIVGLETAFGLAEAVQSGNFYFDNPNAVFTEIDRFTEVTSEDIQRVIETYLQPEQRHIFTAIPGEGEPEEVAEPVVQEPGPDDDELTAAYVQEQDTPPEALPVRPFNLPPITEITLENGLEVIIIQRDELPIISLDLVLPGGSSQVTADKAGLADLTTEVITRGTESRTGPEIAREIEQIGGVIGASADEDWLDIGVFALKDDATTAFELLGDVVLNPTFPEQEIEVNRQRYLSDLETTLSDPGALAGRAFSNIIYANHPYGNLTSAETFNSITRDDIVAFYESQLDADGAFLIVAGDIDVDTATELAETTFGDMPVTNAPDTADFPTIPETDDVRVIIVNRPGPQSQYIIGNLATNRRDPNNAALQVMNEVLGGGVSSRLFQIVREQLGYAYSVGSSFTFNLDTGVFRASGASNNDVTADAIRQILTEIDTLRTETLAPDVVEKARGSLIGIESLALETYQSFVNAVTVLKLNDLPLSRIANRSARFAVVDEGDVRAVAETYIHPEQFVIVVVGDASVLEEPLSEFGTVEVIDPR